MTNDGLSLWYGTPDARAPDHDGVAPRKGASVVVGVHPANPTNVVKLRYRVDGGPPQVIPGRSVRTDYERQVQYFSATFPEFATGDVVEYVPVFSCGGRQVPSPQEEGRFPSRFRLAPKAARPAASDARPEQPTGAAAGQRFGVTMNYVARVAVQFSTPQYVTDTPAGVRVNFFVTSGSVEGPDVSGKVLASSLDHMTVRSDGMGVVRILAAFEISDGAKLDVEAGGYVDFGPDGYRAALAGKLPDRAPIVVTPLITTRDPRPKYRELSRIQCVGVGYTHLDVNQAFYDIYTAVQAPLRK
jgi:hypothetical protein